MESFPPSSQQPAVPYTATPVRDLQSQWNPLENWTEHIALYYL